MKRTNMTVLGCWWASTGDKTYNWSSGDFQSGDPSQGGHYRSRVAISTTGLRFSKSKRVILSVKLTGDSYVSRCKCVLSTNGDIAYNDVQNTAVTDMSDTLAASALATSVALKADGTKYPDGWIGSGNRVYFVFDTEVLKPDSTYYVYVIRTHSGSSWVEGSKSSLTATLSYEEGHIVKIHDGEATHEYQPHIFDGTNWVSLAAHSYDGTVWQPN